MRKASALVLAFVSVASAAVVLSQDHGTIADRLLYGDKNSVATALPSALSGNAPQLETVSRVFSSSQPLLRESAPRTTAVVAGERSTSEPAHPTNTAPNPMLLQPAAQLVADTTVRRLASSRPADDDARRELVKDLQRELKRVGCFDGEVSGTWGPSSKKAMASFTDRVNATLPLDEPDYILLTLVQGHGEKACGLSCPGGQALNDGGKCVPRAVLAHSGRRTQEKPAASTRREEADQPSTVAQARAQSRSVPPSKVASSWSAVVTAPPQAEAQARPPAPALPGRMAIGAPVSAVDAPSDQSKAEIANRRAVLAANATVQRNLADEGERGNRLSEAQARRNRELALQSKTTEIATKQRAAIAPARQPTVAALAALSAPPQSGPSSTETVPATATATNETPSSTGTGKRPAVKRSAPQRIERKYVDSPFTAPRLAAAPARAPAPRLSSPYNSGRVVATGPSPTYTPQPVRWTRTIFNDINRMH